MRSFLPLLVPALAVLYSCSPAAHRSPTPQDVARVLTAQTAQPNSPLRLCAWVTLREADAALTFPGVQQAALNSGQRAARTWSRWRLPAEPVHVCYGHFRPDAADVTVYVRSGLTFASGAVTLTPAFDAWATPPVRAALHLPRAVPQRRTVTLLEDGAGHWLFHALDSPGVGAP